MKGQAFYPTALHILHTAIPAAAKRFGTDERTALTVLFIVLSQSENVKDQREEIAITCAVCADDQWWRDNYGPLWEWAQWWYCGPFGLNCSNDPQP